MTAGILAVGTAVAACGGGPSTPGAATGSTTTPSPSTGGGSETSGLLPFVSCVRAHGVTNFPDPTSRGVFPKEQIAGASVSEIRTAESACEHFLPAGSPLRGVTTDQEQQDYLNGAACMRSHGIANFPDPVFSGSNVNFPIPSSIDTHSAQFVGAQQICQRLIPAGFPYSGRAG
jgi:hypothetical protein